ncbi:MAG: ABC transporter substrate-binding protein [Alphaproteobacteria bacterium]|nr:ABC transporter substrate-binding protein [Alphaproteobacteria bacterium]MBU0797327.1 ABC transporter substrate-binding protein [Alphaproteobacteria bacterium]MBU0888885.1 ABC transporter substrate-binding protein [Alphaproteobacteria bacterium]MBU1813905.1 ABC transporter substrate-binding protein [Alphaproteobacteria bacterium]
MRHWLRGQARIGAVVLALAAFFSVPAQAADWQDTLKAARGQTVYWNAWAGDERINGYIQWVAEKVQAEYGVTLRHVKLSDTGEAVSRVLAEKAAGRTSDGSVDLIWLNGENFAAMKQNGLLHGPFTQALPNFALVDVMGKPTTLVDFTVPTDGLEAPWGMAQFVFMVDTARVSAPPRTIPGFIDWARANPGRFTYPAPPDFIGSTFLKQALSELAADPSVLLRAVDEASFAGVSAPLWAYLDALHPHLWRQGQGFPKTGPALRQLLDDGEVDMALSFHPGEASALIAEDRLPKTVRTFVLQGGTIGNTHFVAIPFNARAKQGAMVVANYLLSPEAQARKQDPAHWGDFTVLDLDALPAAGQQRFAAIERGIATLSDAELGTALPEPHPSWMTRIEAEWLARYNR